MRLSIKELEMLHDSCCTEVEMRKDERSELPGTWQEYETLRVKIAREMEFAKAAATVETNEQVDGYVCTACGLSGGIHKNDCLYIASITS